jgi:outer membrane murein-binding lipoprotein Lpp
MAMATMLPIDRLEIVERQSQETNRLLVQLVESNRLLVELISVNTRKLDAVAADVSVLKTDVSVLKTDVASLNTRVSSLETDMAATRKDIREMRKEMGGIGRRIGDMYEAVIGSALADFFTETFQTQFEQLPGGGQRRYRLEGQPVQYQIDALLVSDDIIFVLEIKPEGDSTAIAQARHMAETFQMDAKRVSRLGQGKRIRAGVVSPVFNEAALLQASLNNVVTIRWRRNDRLELLSPASDTGADRMAG